MPEANLTANAILGKELWRDSFDRTTSSPDWGTDYNITSSTGQVWVDGSVGRISADGYVAALITDQESKRLDYGFVQFDFWVPANTSDFQPYWYVRQGGGFPVGIEAFQASGLQWAVGVFFQYTSIDAYAYFTPTPSTWYRVKGVFNGIHGGILAVKVWKVGDPEPSDFGAVGEISPGSYWIEDPAQWYDLYLTATAPAVEPMGFDNLVFGSYGVPFNPTAYRNLTAGAIKSKTMPFVVFAADAFVIPRKFSAGAWIVGNRSGHSRFWDHYGTQPDTVVVLDGPIGPYPSGATVHYVLGDLLGRIEALEQGWHRTYYFSAGAFILPNLRAAAVIAKTMTYDPWWGNRPTTMKLDAEIRRGKVTSLSAAAVLIRTPVVSFGADAYLINLVC